MASKSSGSFHKDDCRPLKIEIHAGWSEADGLDATAHAPSPYSPRPHRQSTRSGRYAPAPAGCADGRSRGAGQPGRRRGAGRSAAGSVLSYLETVRIIGVSGWPSRGKRASYLPCCIFPNWESGDDLRSRPCVVVLKVLKVLKVLRANSAKKINVM